MTSAAVMAWPVSIKHLCARNIARLGADALCGAG